LFVDLTIKCGTHVWDVHRVVVCAQSEFFLEACDGSADTSKVVLPEESHEVINKMIFFLYNMYYNYAQPHPTNEGQFHE
jgi:hypothetical protein